MRHPLPLHFTKSALTGGETVVLIECSHLISTAKSSRKDLNLAMLIFIYKINYKILLYENRFNFSLQIFCEITLAS
jgi:hypothetical protein